MRSLLYFIFFYFIVGCNDSLPIINENFETHQVDTSFEFNCTYEVEPFYNADTLLSGGYHLKYYYTYSVVDNCCLQIVDLMKGSEKVEWISGLDYRLKHSSLGWLGEDYGKSFLFVTGVSGPNVFQVIEKTTGKETLSGFLHHNINGIVLYSTFQNDSDFQELRVFDGKTNADFVISDFKDLQCKWEKEYFGDCIDIDSVSDSNVWLSIETTKGKVIKKYNRLISH